MNYTIGIDMDPERAAVVILDEMGNVFPTEDAVTIFPRLCTVSAAGEALMGMRALRYNRLHPSSRTEKPDDAAFFAHIAQYLRAQLNCVALPPIVLSAWTVDPLLQSGLMQAAYESGMHILRCLNRAAACAIHFAIPGLQDWRHTLLLHSTSAGTTLFSEADYSDEVLEILSCREYAANEALPGCFAPLYFSDGSSQNLRRYAAHGAAMHAAKLVNSSAVSDYLLLESLAHGFYLKQNNGQLLSFLGDVSIPVRQILTLQARTVRDASGQLHYTFLEHASEPMGSVQLHDPMLQICTELELTVSISVNRNTLLTVRDPASSAYEQFTLLTYFHNEPPTTVSAAQAQDPLRMIDALLTAIDSLENGLRMLSDAEHMSSIGTGMLQIHKQFSAALTQMGVEPIPAEGCLFDPQIHEAVVSMPHEESGWVLQEYRRGYTLNGTLLRAAQVMVSE